MRSAPPSPTAPFLLTVAGFYGTLAATRALGRAGVPVVMADSKVFVPARWSRYVARRETCPPVEEPERLVEWLLDFGRRSPGHVLYPTCDELAWLFSRHREALGKVFRLFQPPLEAVYALLHKGQLQAAAQAVGLEVPTTYFPRTDAELEQVAREATFPLLIKPQTQIFHSEHHKGRKVDDAAALREGFHAACADDTYLGPLHAFDPDATRPMLQRFHTEAAEGIYSISGFVGEDGTLLGARAAAKVLQRPRKLGIGLCFDAAPVLPELAEGLAALARRVGYHGVFEAEFIRVGGRHLLIDFNPRFYSQLAFDEARGLPLAQMAHAAACGDRARLAALAAAAGAWEARGRHVYHHRFTLELMLTLQGLSGRFTEEEVRRWRAWRAEAGALATDAVGDREDWMPLVVDLTKTLYLYARHPRAFVRTVVLDR